MNDSSAMTMIRIVSIAAYGIQKTIEVTIFLRSNTLFRCFILVDEQQAISESELGTKIEENT